MIIARKFNDRLSMALMPSVVYRQFVEINDDNTVYGLGAAGRFKLTSRVSLIADYVLVRRSQSSRDYYRSDDSDASRASINTASINRDSV